MRDRKRVRSRLRSLFLRFPAQIETSASREGNVRMSDNSSLSMEINDGKKASKIICEYVNRLITT
jgi:hypothetical protein